MAKERDIQPEKIRESLLALADLIRSLDEQGRLLDSAPTLLQALGDLRSKLFEYEVRCTGRLLPKSKEPREITEAQRIVDEAVKRLEDVENDWSTGWLPGQEEEEDA